ncbi:MAM domain-containing protein 2 [Bagarius yarrelli]|uniref:MAM domain-containing protein 2 n=1 Tax=Bagarius yarrelli TaxID=175774 RepID=A0A556VX71_BAGYA|nr:MAM domain-containing protein 2 [Bagarius yarrelli]
MCDYTTDPNFLTWNFNANEHFITLDVNSQGDGDMAVLLGPDVELQDWSCLRLIYQITSAGSLQVLSRSEGVSFVQVLWSASSPSDSWIIASIDLQCDFEESHLCGYSTHWSGNVNWYIGRGAPNHRGLSHGADSEGVATLVSPMTRCELGCLSFQYHRTMWMVTVPVSSWPGGAYKELGELTCLRATSGKGIPNSVWIPVQVSWGPLTLQVVFEVSFNLLQEIVSLEMLCFLLIVFYRNRCRSTTVLTAHGVSGWFLLASSRFTMQTLPGNQTFCLSTEQKHRRIWNPSDSTTDVWIQVELSVQTQSNTQLMFALACKSVWNCGSAALDDISLRSGGCDLQSGHYLYIEASMMLPGYSARLLSRPLRGSSAAQCLLFFYHMYGSGTGSLRVLLHSELKDGDTVLWERSGEQSVSWMRASVTYQYHHQHQIVFEATRGPSILSDTAIDDVRFQKGACDAHASRALQRPEDIIVVTNEIQSEADVSVTPAGRESSSRSGSVMAVNAKRKRISHI